MSRGARCVLRRTPLARLPRLTQRPFEGAVSLLDEGDEDGLAPSEVVVRGLVGAARASCDLAHGQG